MNEQLIELHEWSNGKPAKKNNSEIMDKINLLMAEKKFQQILDLTSTMKNSQQTYRIKANASLKLKKYKQVIKICEDALEIDQQSDFYQLKAKALGKLGKHLEKVQQLKKAITLNPTVALYYRDLGAAFYALQDYNKAIKSHQMAIQIKPTNPNNHHNIGVAFLRQKKYGQSILSFDRAIELNPRLSLSYSWKGDCYKAMKQYQKAQNCYIRAYELSGDKKYCSQIQEMKKLIKGDGRTQMKNIFFGLF